MRMSLNSQQTQAVILVCERVPGVTTYSLRLSTGVKEKIKDLLEAFQCAHIISVPLHPAQH